MKYHLNSLVYFLSYFLMAMFYLKKILYAGLKIASIRYYSCNSDLVDVLLIRSDGNHTYTFRTEVKSASCAFDDKYEYLYMTSHQYLTRIS